MGFFSIPIQLITLAVAIAAIHLTYLYYKRKNFTKNELFGWIFLWLLFLVVTTFPRILNPFVGYFRLQRPLDLLMILAFVLIFTLTFNSYLALRVQKRKLEQLVRELALKDLDKK